MPTPTISAPVERNNATEPDASAFIFGMDTAHDGQVTGLDWPTVRAGCAVPAQG
jgi:hypothetical protein